MGSRSFATGLSCSVSITFAPAVEGLRLGTMSIFSNAPGSPHTVALSGRGTRFGDPVPGRWTETDRMGFQRGRGHTATRLPNGQVLIVGGTFGVVASETAELYDPFTGRWQRTGSMHVARTGHTATLLKNGKVLVAGGCSCTLFSNEPTAEIYDPFTRIWTATGNDMNEQGQSFFRGRRGHTATLLHSGQVLVAGGIVAGTAPPQTWGTSEIYDPDADRWGPACSMDCTGSGCGRSTHTATLMPDGRVLAAGGSFNGFPLDTVEVFNPVRTCTAQTPQSAAWARLPATMNFAHLGHTAALLNTGHVLVAGGGAGFGNQSVSELLDPVTGKWIVTGDPTALDFGEQIAGTSSAPLTVILINSGAGPLLITGFAISGAFSVLQNCPLGPASLGAGFSCQFRVIFAPTQRGNDHGSLTITSNAPGSPHTVKLKGKGRKH